MRSRYAMHDVKRGLTLALAAGLAGLGLWVAKQIGTQTTGHFWLAMAVVAASGLVLALANHIGTGTKGLRLRVSPTTFIVAFLPVVVAVGWVLLASQPGSGWQEGRISSWSSSLGILGVVHALGFWSGVLAFGFGVMLALSLDGVPVPEAAPVDPFFANDANDEPVTAERRWTRRRDREDAAPRGNVAETDKRVDEPVRR